MQPTALRALQVYWLLLTISQDQVKNTYVAELRDQCERAALEGYWVRLKCHPSPTCRHWRAMLMCMNVLPGTAFQGSKASAHEPTESEVACRLAQKLDLCKWSCRPRGKAQVSAGRQSFQS